MRVVFIIFVVVVLGSVVVLVVLPIVKVLQDRNPFSRLHLVVVHKITVVHRNHRQDLEHSLLSVISIHVIS